MKDSATVAKVQDMVFNDYVRYIYSSVVLLQELPSLNPLFG